MSDEVTQESKDLAEAAGRVVQPDPVANELPSAHELVAEDIAKYGTVKELGNKDLKSVYSMLLTVFIGMNGGDTDAAINNIAARMDFGLQKYGTKLQPFNGRDSKADANDELADMLVYLRTLIFEDENPQEG